MPAQKFGVCGILAGIVFRMRWKRTKIWPELPYYLTLPPRALSSAIATACFTAFFLLAGVLVPIVPLRSNSFTSVLILLLTVLRLEPFFSGMSCSFVMVGYMLRARRVSIGGSCLLHPAGRHDRGIQHGRRFTGGHLRRTWAT
jgi:hypothetical protein